MADKAFFRKEISNIFKDFFHFLFLNILFYYFDNNFIKSDLFIKL